MRILSWNILHGGGSRTTEILDAIERHEPDVVCLQEMRIGGLSERPLVDGLAELGLDEFFAPPTEAARDNAVAVASRFRLEEPLAWPPGDVRGLRVKVDLETGTDFHLLVAHLPQKKAQVPYWEKLLELPKAEFLEGDALIVGDLNCGIPLVDSDVKTFSETRYFQQMLREGWVDAWRTRHPKAREYSWVSVKKGNGFRYDHALASPSLDPRIESIAYDHEVRENKASDHSALILDLER